MKLFQNTLYTLSILLILFGSIISYNRTNAEVSMNKGSFLGKISFDDSVTHKFSCQNVQAKRSFDKQGTIITIVVIDENTKESVFVKLFDVKDKGTFFIPGEGSTANVGNLIKNYDNYKEISNFYQTTLANDEGLQNGVGRVNITKLTKDEIEGELIIVANNSEGRKAQLESARFKARF
jgi:hypothetical protein